MFDSKITIILLVILIVLAFILIPVESFSSMQETLLPITSVLVSDTVAPMGLITPVYLPDYKPSIEYIGI